MQNKYIEQLKRAALEAFEGEKVRIILFGSRARNTSRGTSDVDIGLIPSGRLNRKKMLLLEEKVERLNIPYKVEIVDLAETSPDFRKEAMKGAVVWKD